MIKWRRIEWTRYGETWDTRKLTQNFNWHRTTKDHLGELNVVGRRIIAIESTVLCIACCNVQEECMLPTRCVCWTAVHIEPASFTETPVTHYKSRRRYIRQGLNIDQLCRENMKSLILFLYLFRAIYALDIHFFSQQHFLTGNCSRNGVCSLCGSN